MRAICICRCVGTSHLLLCSRSPLTILFASAPPLSLHALSPVDALDRLRLISLTSSSIMAAPAYAFHGKARTPITTQQLNQISKKHLRAMAWHNAIAARGTETADVRCIDVHALRLPDLRRHFRTHLTDAAHPNTTQLATMVLAYDAQAMDAHLVSDMITEATRSAAARAPAAARHPRLRGRQAADDAEEEDENGEQTEPQCEGQAGDSDDEGDGQRDISALTAATASTPTSSRSSAAKRSKRASGSDHTAPTTWAGTATWSQPTLASLLPSTAARGRGLAELDAKIIKNAREGKQQYPISDLLRARAEHSTAPSASVLDDERTIVLDTQTGILQQATGATTSALRSAAQRRRQIVSFSDVVEVFFSLVSPIYEGRPDIGSQIFSLLCIAHELDRVYSLDAAVDYINLVRLAFHNSPAALGRHVLAIDTTYDMGAVDQTIWWRVMSTAQMASNTSRPAQRQTQRAQAATGRAEQSNDICRSFNNGSCTRATCKFQHRCHTCNSAAHAAPQCPRTQAQRGGGRQASAPATTSAGSQRPAGSTTPAPAGGPTA